MHDFLYPEIKGENRLLIFSINYVFNMFSKTIEKQLKDLLDKNLEFLSSVFLSMGVTEATFGFSGNKPFFILLFIDREIGLSR